MNVKKAYNCFVCWYFETYDLFETDDTYKEKILKKVDKLEREIGAPFEIEYVTNDEGRTHRILHYENALSDESTLDVAAHNAEMNLKDPTETLKEYITKCMDEAVAHIDETIVDSTKEISEKLDGISQILNELIKQIESYQSLVQSQIELAVTDDEIDRIVHAYSEECVSRIIKGIDEKYSDITRQREEEKLIDTLGRRLWEKKLTPSSRNYLVSSKVTYNYYCNISTLDYSGVCLLVTKALELEMSERFYKSYVAFLKRGYSDSWKNHLDDFPTPLIKTIKGVKVLKSLKDFTLGSVSYVLCASEDRNATEEQRKNNEKCLVEFAKDGLIKRKTDDEILSALKEFGAKIADITEEYRNKAAHTNALGRIDAETCFKIVIDTEQLLKKMLDMFEY